MVKALTKPKEETDAEVTMAPQPDDVDFTDNNGRPEPQQANDKGDGGWRLPIWDEIEDFFKGHS